MKFYPPMVRRDFCDRVSIELVATALPHPQVVATGVLQDTLNGRVLENRDSLGESARAGGLCDRRAGRHSPPPCGTDRNRVPELNATSANGSMGSFTRHSSNYRVFAGQETVLSMADFQLPAFLQSAGMSVVESLAEDDLSLIHADLTEDHVLLVPKGSSDRPPTPQTGQLDSHGPSRWQVEALFDFGDAEVAPPYYEWIPVWYSLLRNQGSSLLLLTTGCT